MKNKTYRNLLSGSMAAAAIMALTVNAGAAPLTPDQALTRLYSANTPMKISGDPALQLAHTAEDNGQNTIYVFNSGQTGFVITPADDRIPAVLAYSDNGSFDIDNASPALLWWIDQYSQEAAYIMKENLHTIHDMAKAPRQNIAPMLTTTWNQTSPYNNDCPTIGYTRCVTGCVATAMAQVMNYHKYPVTGTGSHSYTWRGTQLSFNFGATTFDWNNMIDNYSGSATNAQKSAVAKLMYACGVSVDMDYTENSSGASDIYAAYALKTYFNYDKGVRYLSRSFFPDAEWESLVYDEIAAGRPVIYGGQAAGGGHEFICDGYENGYFHVNWGWGGLGDGYFLLSALDPGLSGVGGASGGYNYYQTAVVGIGLPVPGSQPWYPIYGDSGISVTGYSKSIVTIKFAGGIYNYSPENLTVDLVLKAVSVSNGAEYKSKSRSLEFGKMDGINVKGWGEFQMYLPTGLPAGTYHVYPCILRPDGSMQDVLMPFTDANYFVMTVAGNSVTITDGEPEVKASIQVTDFTPDSKVERNVPARFNVCINNTGQVTYSGNITAHLYSYAQNKYVQSNPISGVNIPAGTSFNGYVNITINQPDGKYAYYVYDMYDQPVSEAFVFWIGKEDGIEAIPADYDSADVYNTSGMLLMKGASRDNIDSLPHGVYIVVISGKSYKITR